MLLQTFLLAFFVSLLGSIPPGTINVSVMKLGMEGRVWEGYSLAVGATLIEWVYVLLVIQFQIFVNDQAIPKDLFILITAFVMAALGIYSLLKRSSNQFSSGVDRGKRRGFIKGLLLGVLNPLAIPFWLAVSFYFESNSWVLLDDFSGWLYSLGVVFGSLVTLYLATNLGRRFSDLSENQLVVRWLPGLLFLGMGGWNFYQFLNL